MYVQTDYNLGNCEFWIKLLNVPLEAWSVKGISTLASCLGKPIIMDEITTKMRMTGVGRLGYARLLVEINAEQNFKNVIEVVYRKKDASTIMTKFVEVENTWKPYKCGHCCVFGHEESKCRMVPKGTEEDKEENVKEKNDDGFKQVQNRKVRVERDTKNNRRNEMV